MTDYTGLPINTEIDGKVIKKCPHCGRPGLVEEKDGKTSYIHREAVVYTTNGGDALWDACPK